MWRSTYSAAIYEPVDSLEDIDLNEHPFVEEGGLENCLDLYIVSTVPILSPGRVRRLENRKR